MPKIFILDTQFPTAYTLHCKKELFINGGDPFIFGRDGEEAEVLIAQNVPFEVIPGVTSAIAVFARLGIPFTHRGFMSTVAFVTGHEDLTREKSDIDCQAFCGIGTLVILMSVKNLGQITRELMARQIAPDAAGPYPSRHALPAAGSGRHFEPNPSE